MKNIYKTRPHRVLVNLVFGIAAALVLAFIASIWLKGLLWFVLIFAAVFAGYVWLVIIDNIIVIETDADTLTVKKGKKIDVYPISTTSVRAKTVTSSGDTECSLYLTRQGEQEVFVDCELIGVTQFMKLLGDLGITGDSVTKLDTAHTAASGESNTPHKLTTMKEDSNGRNR